MTSNAEESTINLLFRKAQIVTQPAPGMKPPGVGGLPFGSVPGGRGGPSPAAPAAGVPAPPTPGAAPAPMAPPPGGVGAPAPRPGQPVPPPSPQAAGGQREQKVRQVIQQLRQLLADMADAIYEMRLTDNQVSELASKMLVQLGEAVQEITVERVKDIANDLLLEEVTDRRRKRFTT